MALFKADNGICTCRYALIAIDPDRPSLSYRRQMLGVHYRADSIEGMLLGETYIVRMLLQVC